MRNHQNRPWILLQMALEPKQGMQIEVVGRLVQQQQIRCLHQQSRKVRPHRPPSAQFPRLPLKIPFAEPQPAQNLLRLCLQLKPAQLGVARVRIHIILLPRMIHPGDSLLIGDGQPAPRRHKVGMQRNRDLNYPLIGERGGLLRQKPERRPPIHRDLPRVRLLPPEDHVDQRRFPSPVRPHQPDPLTTVHLQRRTGQQIPAAKTLLDINNRKHLAASPGLQPMEVPSG